LVIDNEADLKGLPQNVINGAASLAKKTAWKVNGYLQPRNQAMLPFLTYDENRGLRKKIYDAYLTRGNHNDNLEQQKSS